MHQEPHDVLDQLDAIADELNTNLAGTYYEALGQRMADYITDLRRALSHMFRPPTTAQRFFLLQKSLLKELRETQALIRLSMDQNRPMTHKQLALYLDCNSQTIDRVAANNEDFPKPGYFGQKRMYRKHEIDTWLFRHNREPMQSTTPLSRTQSVENVIRMKSYKKRRKKDGT